MKKCIRKPNLLDLTLIWLSLFNKLTLETAIDNVVASMRVDSEAKPEKEEETPMLRDSFFIKNGSILQKVKFSEIRWIQSEGNYCTLFTNTRKHADPYFTFTISTETS